MKALATSTILTGVAWVAILQAQDTVQKEVEILRGRWSAVAAIQADGKLEEVKQDDPKHFTFEFTDEKLITVFKKGRHESQFKLDHSKTPKNIDVVRLIGKKELHFKGIYAVDGERLRFCLAGPGEQRPTKFAPGEGIEFAIELKRMRKQP